MSAATEADMREPMVYMASILTTVAESPEGAPEGVLYAGLMGEMGLELFKSFIGLMEKTNLIERHGLVLKATELGLLKAQAIEKAIEGRRA
jgi:hypothetical protein